MAWSYGFHSTIFGTWVASVEPSAHSWSSIIDGYSSADATFQTRAAGAMPPEEWNAATTPWTRMLVAFWNGVPKHAGLVVSATEDVATGEYVLKLVEIRGLIARRFLWGVQSYIPTDKLEIAGVSLRGLARAVAMRVASGGTSGQAPRGLPIDFGAAESGTVSRTFYAPQFDNADDLITAIESMAGGPDTHFQIMSTPTGVGWWMRIGSPKLGLVGVEWNVGTPESPIRSLKITRDGGDQYSGVFVLGEGSGEDMLVGRGFEEGADPLPIMDKTVQQKTVSSQDALNSLAGAAIEDARGLREEWSMTATRSVTPAGDVLGPLDEGIVPGSILHVTTPATVLASEGLKRFYVTGMSGDMTETVKLTVERLP